MRTDKIVVLFLSLIFFGNIIIPCGKLYAEVFNPAVEASLLIKDDLYGNKNRINVLAADLSERDKLGLYNLFEKDWAMYSALNFIVLFGFGSFFQGDDLGGIILGSIDLAGFTTLTMTSIFPMKGKKIIGATAYGAIMLNRLFGAVIPYLYAGKYNHMLEKTLNINSNEKNSVDIQSSFECTTEGIGFTLSLCYNY